MVVQQKGGFGGGGVVFLGWRFMGWILDDLLLMMGQKILLSFLDTVGWSNWSNGIDRRSFSDNEVESHPTS